MFDIRFYLTATTHRGHLITRCGPDYPTLIEARGAGEDLIADCADIGVVHIWRINNRLNPPVHNHMGDIRVPWD